LIIIAGPQGFRSCDAQQLARTVRFAKLNQVMSRKRIKKKDFAYLGVNQDANNFAVADHLVEVVFDALLAQVVGPLLAGLGESLSLARVPDVPKTMKS
jgi:hypothetical protein